jgi:phosphoribosylglycinamide formyltransferase-1
MSRRLRVAVLVSGSGTNLQALLDAADKKELGPADVVCVVSNVEKAKALDRARAHGVEALFIDHRAFPDRASFDAALESTLSSRNVDLVVLAGFMRLLTTAFLGPFRDRVVNVHPSLLPAFPGAHAVRDALAYGVRVTGCTVHFVDEGTDTGPIIAQAVVPVSGAEDESALHARIQGHEHALLVRVVRAIAEGRVSIAREGDARPRVRIAPGAEPVDADGRD